MQAMRLVTVATMTATLLLAGYALPGAATAAASAKPAAGCALRSGATSPDGTQVGTWKCEGARWHKVAAIQHQPMLMMPTNTMWCPSNPKAMTLLDCHAKS